jgi:hypothetical protein
VPRLTEVKPPDRKDVLQTIKTPLGFFTLVVLVVEIVFGVAAGLSRGLDRTYLIVGMLALMFILVLIVAGLTFYRPDALLGKRPTDKSLDFARLSPGERIAKYRQLIEQETRNAILSDFRVPEGYSPEVSTIPNLTFGFCYPKSWVFSPLPQQVVYGSAEDPHSPHEIGFARNVNVVISDISAGQEPLNELYEACIRGPLLSLSRAKLVFRDDDFIFQGLRAIRFRMDWIPQDEEKRAVALYRISVADKERKKLYHISFTTLKEDFDNARPIFDNIAATFRI